MFRFLDVDRSGKITVKEWSKMISFLNSFKQENALMATPAIVDGTIYVRTENNVYAFGLLTKYIR